MNEKTNKGRILYADLLRIIATFSIIVFHVSTDKWYSSFSNIFEWNIVNFFVSELRWGVPLFFMLSGMNFLNPDKNISTKKIYTKYIPHILAALIFWGITYKSLALGFNYISGSKEINLDNILEILSSVFFGGSWMHLWFLYTLIAIYILTPSLRVFTSKAQKNDLIYLLLLYFIFASFIPHVDIVRNLNFSIKIPDLVAYTGYFIAGYFFSRYDLSTNQKRILYALAIIMILFMFIDSYVISIKAGSPIAVGIFKYESFSIAIIASAIFVIAKDKINNNTKFANRFQDNKYINLLSSCSFGIYLSHMIFINVLQIIGLTTIPLTNILAIPLNSIIIFVLSLIITLIIRKIPIIGKWII